MGSELQLTTLLDEARSVLAALSRAAHYVTHPWDLAADVAHAVEVLADPPPGDPDACDDLAATWDDAAAVADAAASALDGLRSRDLPAAMVGVAAGTAAEALAALKLLAADSATGLAKPGPALRTYADALRDARARHARGHDLLGDAARAAPGVVDVVHAFGIPTPVVDPAATARNVARVLDDLSDGVRECVGAYEDALVAVRELRRHLSDAAGYARLADVEPVGGWSVLDVATLAAAGPVADPDHAELDPLAWAGLRLVLDELPPDERAALDALLAAAPDALTRAAVLRAVAGGASPEQVAFLAAALAGMSAADRRRVLSGGLVSTGTAATTGAADVTLDGTTFEQWDGTTCGSTSLLQLAVQHDPLLAVWLATGRRSPGWSPAVFGDLTDAQWAAGTVEERLKVAQDAVHDDTNGMWPLGLGTSPWGAAGGAQRLTGVDHETLMIDDQDRELLSAALTRAAEAANRGLPVPLYVGGDRSDGLDAAIPRHVVLITGYRDGRYEIFEPSDGTVVWVPEQEILDGGGPALDAFAGWTHPDWVVLPKVAS